MNIPPYNYYDDITNIILTQDFFPKIGGAHLFLYEVYKRWPNPVVVLTQDYSNIDELGSQQAKFDASDHRSIKIIRELPLIDDINLFSTSYWSKLLKTLRITQRISGKKPMILHCLRAFPEGINALMFKALKNKNCKIVTFAHGEEVLVAKTSKQLKILTKIVYSKSNVVMANSNSTKTLVKELAPNANVKIVHPGVDTRAFDVPEERVKAYRRRWGWKDDVVVLLTMSRMEARKNHAAVIKALGELHEEGLPLAYVIAGEGEEEPRLKKMVSNLGLSEWVRFVGRIPEGEKPLCFCAADIHVMPSIQLGPMTEGFGIVFLEAAAAGIPSIAGKVGGQSEAVRDGVTGLLVDGTKIDEVKNAIRKLAQNRRLRAEMGQNGKILAEKYDWSKVSAGHFRVVENLIFEKMLVC